MRKTRQKSHEKGITLIALVVTIVVLLILAGVSINLVIGNNGIITKAKDARLETRAASVEDKKDLWKADKEAGTYIETTQVQTLEELLDSLLQENLITETERNEIEEKGHTVIGSKYIVFADGFIDATYIVENSNDEVIFNKIIREGDVALEKPGFTNYTIEGISNDKEGTYISAGSVEGKSGNLEIIGNISDTTFRYNLTDFMKGDETFYCKINIDDEIFYKKINVIQGDAVTYEEDFEGINYTEGTWTVDENENYNNGIAKMTDTIDAYSRFKFNYTGTGVEILSRTNSETGHLIINSGEYRINIKTDNNQEYFNVNILKDRYKNLESGQHSVNIVISKSNIDLNRNRYFYLDAIKIYR